jgi:hypothetical protein
MLDLIDALDVFELGVLDNDPRTKRFVDGDVDVPADRGRDYKASVLLVIGREVGAAAAEADSQRTPGYDHRAGPRVGQYAFAETMLKS